MTKKDKKLIKKANEYCAIQWFKVDELIEQAESEEAKNELRTISSRLYHQEEYFEGLL